MVKTRNAQKAHMPELFVALALHEVLPVCFQTSLRFCYLAGRKQSVSIRNRESLLPSMALLISNYKGIGHLVLLWRGRFQATAIHLRDIGPVNPRFSYYERMVQQAFFDDGALAELQDRIQREGGLW
jgi:hypothetical protein